MARVSIGKRRRFEVFHRDHFTCQYCGGQPPDVVLQVDHIVADSKGGSVGLDNLLTACEACNQGKSDRDLEILPSRPDADLLWLAAQQELVEMRRYQLLLKEKEAVVALLRDLITKYSPEIAGEAVIASAYAVNNGRISYGDGVPPYLRGIARNMAEGE